MPLLDSIPGIARQSAELLLAEIGSDMRRFPSAAHLCKWAGVCPGNHESAGKQYSGKNATRKPLAAQYLGADGKCCRALQSVLLCHGLPPTGTTSGTQRAIVAVAHRLLIAVYHILKQHQPYRDYRTVDTGQRTQHQLIQTLQSRIERLGYQVHLTPIAIAQPPS